jgi:hypothetical protein
MTSRIRATMMRAGRAAVLMTALAVALVAALGATTALAAVPGDPLKLAQRNVINALTTLAGNRAGGALLQVRNDGGPALTLAVPAGQPPALVSEGAAKVVNLDADKLDGKDAAAFVPTKTYIREVNGLGKANNFDDVSATCDPGDLAIGGGYNGVDRADTFVAVDQQFKTGWQVIWFSANQPDALRVRAICADVA